MKKPLNLISILACIICFSCKDPETRQIQFSRSYSIVGDTVQTNTDNISGLLVVNNYLIGSQFSGDHFLKVYDTANFQEIGVLATKGSEENQFPTVLMVDQYERCGSDDCLWVHDLNKGVLTKINITKSLKDDTTVVDEKITTQAESRFHTVFYIDSLLVVGRSTNSTPQMNRLQVYNPHADQIVETVALFPEIDRTRNDLDFTVNKYNTLYLSHIGLKPDKTRIASAMSSFDRIDIFKTDGKLEKSVFDGKEIPENLIEYLEESDSHKLKVYYCGIFTSEKYIYALYYGQAFSEYGKTPIPTQIRIFDWNGNPLSKIGIKEYLFGFTIDEQSGLMYGIDYLNKMILKYNIKHVLNEL